MSGRNPLVEAAHGIQQLCLTASLPFCFIGGLAVLRWGEPRLTRDVDLTVLAGYGDEGRVTDHLLASYEPRLDNAREFAIANRVVLVRSTDGIPIDIALGALPFEARTVERATVWSIAERALQTCSAEDLVVHKVFAGRPHDWNDVAGVLERSGPFDADLVVEELRPLLAAKHDTTSLDRFLRLVDESR